MTEINKPLPKPYSIETPPSKIPGDVSQEFIVAADLVSEIFSDRASDAQVTNYLREMSKRELGLKTMGHEVTKKPPHSDATRIISKFRNTILLSPMKKEEGTLLKGGANSAPA